MKLTRPRKIVLKRLVHLVSLLSTVTKRNITRGGVALDLQAIAGELDTEALRTWHAEAAAQLRAADAKRRRHRG